MEQKYPGSKHWIHSLLRAWIPMAKASSKPTKDAGNDSESARRRLREYGPIFSTAPMILLMRNGCGRLTNFDRIDQFSGDATDSCGSLYCLMRAHWATRVDAVEHYWVTSAATGWSLLARTRSLISLFRRLPTTKSVVKSHSASGRLVRLYCLILWWRYKVIITGYNLCSMHTENRLDPPRHRNPTVNCEMDH